MKDVLSREYITAVRIVDSNRCENEEVLLKNCLIQTVISQNDVCSIKKDGYIILDFGKEIHGSINITIQVVGKDQYGKMRIVFGESVTESMSKIGEKNATNNHSIRDMTVDVTTFSNFECGKTGFRFVKLEVLSSEIVIKSVQAVCIYKDVKYEGSFSCDNELINKIWLVGAYTVHLNMQDYLWDGIKRDRMVWIGDMHPETSIIMSVFGYDAAVVKSLDLIRDNTIIDEWMNTYPAYSMWWVKIHRDWYYQNGNLEYLQQQEEYLYPVLNKILGVINDDGTNTIEKKFVDWSSKDTPAMEAGIYAMLHIALNAGVELCEILGNHQLAIQCNEKIQVLKQYNPHYYNNKQVAALLAYSGVRGVEEINKEILSIEPLKGLSTFLGFYVLNVRAMANDMDGCIDILENYWGKMIEMGATTFWEDFDLEWTKNAFRIDEIPVEGKRDVHGDNGKYCYTGFRHSLCHGWAGGPTAFLSRYVLGVEILEPGCKKVRIKPNLGKLNFVKGTYPTPYGNIEIEHKKIEGKIQTIINAPKEVEYICD